VVKRNHSKKGDSKMPNIEQIKQKAIDDYTRKISLILDEMEAKKKDGTLHIDELEALLCRGMEDSREVLISASEELVKVETDEMDDKKNNVRTAKKH
jgi:hypothetical protein